MLEVSGSNAAHDAEKMDAFLEALMSDGIIENGVMAQGDEQSSKLWGLRENITVALNQPVTCTSMISRSARQLLRACRGDTRAD